MRRVSRTAASFSFPLLVLAVALPPLVVGSGTPEPVLHLGLASLFGFGVWLLVAPPWSAGPSIAPTGVGPGHARPSQGSFGEGSVMAALCLGWLAAGLVSAVFGIVQYVWPAWGGDSTLPGFIATPSSAGRAMGNVRQPNQLTTLLALALCGAVWWAQARAWPRRLLVPVMALLALGIVLSGSRMGWLMLAMLSAWGALDRRLRPGVRQGLMAALPLAAAFAVLAWLWGRWGGVTFFPEARMHSASDISSSRFAIWSNTLALIAEYPWAGVGWGHFNFAWTFTPFPDRPVAFFDHTHNLVLQLAVELGVPMTLVLLGTLGALMWRARGGLSAADEARSRASRVALMMLALVGLHSLLEYPLWYAYFLLPTAVALAVYLGAGGVGVIPPGRERVCRVAGVLARVAGLVMIAGAVQAAWEYERVVQIFAPQGEAGERPLSERIRAGQRSRWFGHHADYAAVTTASRPGPLLATFERPLHHLVDARLMIAYAKALHESGEQRRALYVAQRLREFRHPLGDEWFAACERAAEGARPWHCDTTPVTEYGFEDLEPRAVLAARQR